MISLLLTTNTFRDWFNTTNDIINALNANTLVAGIVANGAFTVNGSLSVVNTFFANASVVQVYGNTTFAANTSANSSCNVWNFACGSLLIQPLNGTIVNTAITVNALSTFLQGVTINANVAIAATFSLTGNSYFDGTISANGGPIIAQQVVYGSAGSMIAAILTSPEYDNYAPAGGQGAMVWNLTPNINVTLTGIAAPTEFVTGAQLLYIQNLSNTYTISFASANNNSSSGNQFETPGNTTAMLAPGAVIALIWTSASNQWSLVTIPLPETFAALNVSGNGIFGAINVSTTLQVTGNTALGNTTIAGWANALSTLQVGGLSTFTGNVTTAGFVNVGTTFRVAGLTTLVGNVTTGNTTIAGSANIASILNVVGATTLTNLTLSGYVNITSTLQVAGVISGNGSSITSLNASNLATGTLPNGVFPSTLPATSGINLTSLNASNLGSGTIPNGVFPATLPAISGVNLTSLNASAITSGTLPFIQLPTGTGNWAANTLVTGTFSMNYSDSMTSYQSRLVNTIYTNTSDGFLFIYQTGAGESGTIYVNGSGLVVPFSSTSSVTLPIGDGSTWEVIPSAGSGLMIIWIPFGRLGT